ncbi:hypothetical protein N431DRAFT_339092 [Stipitochalara longipes BDJ]|nr:hypothetical protein N431DRAFT_339092 [Stipitochalara longipes BDJ]
MAFNSAPPIPNSTPGAQSLTYKPKGYHKLAEVMSRDMDAAIFHRFEDLGLLSLLSLQAEIIHLRKEFRRKCFLNDEFGHEFERSYSGNFKSARDGDSEQYQILKTIQSKLGEYLSRISKLETPRRSQLSGLKGELNDSANNFLRSTEVDTWGEKDTAAYMCLNPKQYSNESDVFTRLIENIIVGPYHKYIGHRLQTGKVLDEETGSRSYDSEKINTASNVIATVLSAILPVLTIFVLNLLETTNQRIGLTVLFTAVFALMLVTFSSTRRVEIFAATAT